MELSAIGYFSKPHGVKGQLILRTEKDFAVEDLKVLFVEVSGAKAPYFVSSYKENNVGIIMTLEDIDAVEKARPLVGKKIFVSDDLLLEEEGEEQYIGYTVIDKHHGLLGKVVSFTNNGHQQLITVDHGGKEIMLPLVDAFIERMDEPGKTIYFDAPQGLIDLYLGGDDEEE